MAIVWTSYRASSTTHDVVSERSLKLVVDHFSASTVRIFVLRQPETSLTVRLSVTIVAPDRPIFHINQITSLSSIGGAAPVTIGIRARIHYIALNGLVPFINPYNFVLVIVQVTVDSKE
jgi:hypothetical protein